MTRIRPLAPWRDATAAVVLQLLETHAQRHRRIIVDLHGCPCADTSQLAVLLVGERHARETGARLQVAGRRQLRHLAKMCRVDELLEWVGDATPKVA